MKTQAGKKLTTREIVMSIIQYKTTMKLQNAKVRAITGLININSG